MSEFPSNTDGRISPSALIQEYMKNVADDAKAKNKQIKYRTPILSRRWVPYACVFSLFAIWVPDAIKVAGLMYLVDGLDRFKFNVHREYWRWTMSSADYATLIKQIEEGVAKKELMDRPDCPL